MPKHRGRPPYAGAWQYSGSAAGPYTIPAEVISRLVLQSLDDRGQAHRQLGPVVPTTSLENREQPLLSAQVTGYLAEHPAVGEDLLQALYAHDLHLANLYVIYLRLCRHQPLGWRGGPQAVLALLGEFYGRSPRSVDQDRVRAETFLRRYLSCLIADAARGPPPRSPP